MPKPGRISWSARPIHVSDFEPTLDLVENLILPVWAWAILELSAAILCTLGWAGRMDGWFDKGSASLWFSSIALIPAVMTLVVFGCQFELGYDAWIPTSMFLFLMNPFMLLFSLFALLLPPRSPGTASTLFARVLVVLCVLESWAYTVRYFPTA